MLFEFMGVGLIGTGERQRRFADRAAGGTFRLRDFYDKGRLTAADRNPDQLPLLPLFDLKVPASALGTGAFFRRNRKMEAHGAPFLPLEFLVLVNVNPLQPV